MHEAFRRIRKLRINLLACGALILFFFNVLFLEWIKHTIFRIPFTHTLARAAATDYRADNAVNIWSATPFLVRKDIDSHLLLRSLDEIDISQHALVFEFARKLSRNGSVRVETGE